MFVYYLYDMRFILLIFLMACYTGAFAGSEAPILSETSLVESVGEFKQSQISKSPRWLDFTAHITRSKHLKNFIQHRAHSFAKPATDPFSVKPADVKIVNTLYVSEYDYCKPIRLILIFPQHYFW